ncbi:uncharacterized protein LOC135081830 [Ostrinia nubilalis]|uniref:uncharacterized protein LOC135081830 n=1 Tax=Ostrinia nubilalis TaxID=29057 RepID=UPI0030826885
MFLWCVVLLVIDVHGWSHEKGLTPSGLAHVDDLKDVGHFGDAQHRGHKWYDLATSREDSGESDLQTDVISSSSSISSSVISSSSSSEASSAETKERRKATQSFRTCTPCPQDMLKAHNNVGIKWLCGGYQRARRSFKSECMMRYRNCQDGTLFVKLYDHRCKNDSYHGKHWFYVYKV